MSTIMFKEARQTPGVVRRQTERNAGLYRNAVWRIKGFQPKFVYIVARGSSDHAGVFAKYLIEIELGVPVIASAPSVTGVFKQQLKLDSALAIVISQSGKSPDIVNGLKMAKSSGALCLAMVNDEESSAAELADIVLPLAAGEEKAVAATKSYLATLSCIIHLVAIWKESASLQRELHLLPNALDVAMHAPAQLQQEDINEVRHCVVLGRGFGYAIAREIALKLKEVCCLHAEAFSSAEFIHGPVALVEKGLLIIDVSVFDESYQFHQTQIEDIKCRGGKVVTLQAFENKKFARIQPLLIMQRFYLDIEEIARSLGFNPDEPVGLKKVTMTH